MFFSPAVSALDAVRGYQNASSSLWVLGAGGGPKWGSGSLHPTALHPTRYRLQATESFSGVRGDFSERLESLPSRSERL